MAVSSGVEIAWSSAVGLSFSGLTVMDTVATVEVKMVSLLPHLPGESSVDTLQKIAGKIRRSLGVEHQMVMHFQRYPFTK